MGERLKKEVRQVDKKIKGGVYCDQCGAGPQKMLHYLGMEFGLTCKKCLTINQNIIEERWAAKESKH